MKTPSIFVRIGNNVGLYQTNSGIKRRFQNRGKICETYIVQDKINLLNEYSLKTQFLVLEYSLNFMSKNQHRL